MGSANLRDRSAHLPMRWVAPITSRPHHERVRVERDERDEPAAGSSAAFAFLAAGLFLAAGSSTVPTTWCSQV